MEYWAPKKTLRKYGGRKTDSFNFLYKRESGEIYTYNILDGKQRIESLILFIGNERNNLKIDKWGDYFFGKADKKNVNFRIEIDDEKVGFKDLTDGKVRAFGEYVIPTVEITMGEDTELSEIISLFVDINQQGVAVKRFDIVKAMCRNDKIMKQTFSLIATKQRRRKDIFYKMVGNEFTYVFKKTSSVAKTVNASSKVDKMWERLLEIAIFAITKQHRKPVDVLKEFIGSRREQLETVHELGKDYLKNLREIFRFLKKAYVLSHQLSVSKLATDMTHFYTMVTTFLNSDLIRTEPFDKLVTKLVKFSDLINKNGKGAEPKIRFKIKNYLELSTKHTTDVDRRKKREESFLNIINNL